jgi:hypothetical protein
VAAALRILSPYNCARADLAFVADRHFAGRSRGRGTWTRSERGLEPSSRLWLALNNAADRHALLQQLFGMQSQYRNLAASLAQRQTRLPFHSDGRGDANGDSDLAGDPLVGPCYRRSTYMLIDADRVSACRRWICRQVLVGAALRCLGHALGIPGLPLFADDPKRQRPCRRFGKWTCPPWLGGQRQFCRHW